MSYAHEELAEWTEAMVLHRNSRPEQNVVSRDVRVDTSVIVIAIVPVDIDHQTNPRQ
jgi:hypothetical protein